MICTDLLRPMRTWWWSVVNALALPELGWEESCFVVVSLIVEEGIQIFIFFLKKKRIQKLDCGGKNGTNEGKKVRVTRND